ncbi:MAG: M23 family metallopeptidase, partial [Polyangiales bacterium]
GFVGSTGNSTGPHLHLEAYKNFLGREIHDPMTFLASKTTTERCDSEVRTLEIIWRRNAAGELKLAITSKNPQPSEDSETTPRKAVIYVDGEKTAENLTFAQGSTTESDENVEVFLAEMDYIPNLSSKHFSIEVHGLVNGKVVAAGIAMIPSSVANEPAVFVRQVIPNDPNNATFAIGLEGLKPDGAEGIAAYADGCGAKQGLGCLLNPKEDGSDVRTGGTWFSTRASTSAAPTTPENNAVEVRATFNETSRRRTLGARAVLTGESIPEGQALPSDKPQLKNISLKPSYLHGVSQTGTDPTVPSGK